MKKLTIILIALFLGTGASAQTSQPCSSCLPEGIVFNSQAQIDSFQINYPGCNEIEGNVTISGSGIANLNGLGILNSIRGGLKVEFTEILVNLSGLQNITYLGGTFEVDEGHNLVDLAGLEGLTSIGGDIIICRSSLTTLNGLNNLTSIGGGVFICLVPLTNLEGLEKLTSISGNFDLWDVSNLTTLSALNHLTSIGGGLAIVNSKIDSLDGFTGLNSIEGDLTIKRNPELLSLRGLHNLVYIGGSVRIGDCEAKECMPDGNPILLDMTGLDQLYAIGGTLAIMDNDAMTDFTGLEHLKFIGGDLDIRGNESLVSLSGLEGLTNIGGGINIGGYLWGIENPSLTDISALGNVDGASLSSLTIKENASLSTCNVKSICDYLAIPGAVVDIDNNAYGCDTVLEVLADCEFGLEDNADRIFLSVSPNPSSNIFNVSFTIEHPEKVILEVYNSLGQIIAVVLNENIRPGKHQVTLNGEGLPPGIYFYNLTFANQSSTGKLVVVR